MKKNKRKRNINTKINVILLLIMLIFLNVFSTCNYSFATSANDKEEKEKAIARDANNSLKELSVEGYEFYPTFNKNITNYYLTIPTDVIELKVKASTDNDKAKYVISGNKITKKDGTIKVTVTPVNGVKKTYNINVSKQNDNELKLQKLEIENAKITPTFSESKYYYDVEASQMEIKPLKITVEANESEANIEIIGNDESLVEGNNIISIIISNEEETTTYELNVNITKQFTIEQVNNENKGKIEEVKNWLVDFFSIENNIIAVLAALSVILIIVIIIVIIKIKKKNKR